MKSDFDSLLFSLSSWFEKSKRELPWRENPTPYRVWISEIMLQQTQVKTVTPYFECFISRFPDVKSLAEADIEEVLTLWSGLGYYRRARHLHAAAKIIAEKGFPQDKSGWLDLPGVGDYTAGAVLSIAFGMPEAILDGNIKRVLCRWKRLKKTPKLPVKLWEMSRVGVTHAEKLGISPSIINQALMELGAVVCTPKNPDCGSCSVSFYCRAFQRNEVSLFPESPRKIKWEYLEEEVHVLLDDRKKTVLQKIPKEKWRGGTWDFLSEIPDEIPAELVDETEVRLTVTNHKIVRRILIYRASLEEIPECLKKVHLSEIRRGADLGFPIGAPAYQTAGKVRKK